MKSNWNKDLKFEKEITEFLNNNTDIFKEIGVIEISDNNLIKQKAGIDLTLDGSLGVEKCDIKSIAQYNFNTFCFELQGIYKSENYQQQGWLINENLETDCYLLTWHSIKGGSGKYWEDKTLTTKNNIDKIYALLIKKVELMNLIYSDLNISLKDIIKRINDEKYIAGENFYFMPFQKGMKKVTSEVRKNYLSKKLNIPFYIVQSNKIAERPINIVISKDNLEKIAIKKWDIIV